MKGRALCLYYILSSRLTLWVLELLQAVKTSNQQLVHASACVCRDIEHAESLESRKEA